MDPRPRGLWLAAGAAGAAAAAAVAALALRRGGPGGPLEEDDHLRLSRLAIRLLHTPLPADGPQAAYLFQELDCNVPSVVQAALEVRRQRPGVVLFTVGVDNGRLGLPIASGYGAAPYLLEQLRDAGLDVAEVELADFDHSGQINTLNESEAFVRHARRRGWTSVAVLAPAFHLLRASLTAGSVARREYPELRLHPVAGAPLPWHEAAQHSQGALGTRADFIDAELGRIARYTAKGDILPWRELETFFAACER